MYYLLKKQSFAPSTPAAILSNPSLDTLKRWLPMDRTTALLAVDLETRGTDATDPASTIVGIGIADGHISIYVDIRELSDICANYMKDYLRACKRLVAFNVVFDASFLYKWCGQWLSWEADTFGLFKQLSGEGFKGQRWNLETLQKTVLGWDVSNKAALDEALTARGLTKGDMWQLPTDILGPYCAQDAEAAWQGYKYLLEVCGEQRFDELVRYHREDFMAMARLLVIQQHSGIEVDVAKLTTYHADLTSRIGGAMSQFMSHPTVAPFIAEFNELAVKQHAAMEPPKLTIKGEPSVRWQRWQDGKEAAVAKRRFNPNSKKQLAWLFYERLGCRILKKTPKGAPTVDKSVLPSLGDAAKALVIYNKLLKERGYVEGCLAHVRDGLLHPQFRWPGTLTGRPAGGGGFNLLQQPKSRGYLECLRTRSGNKLIQLDFSALEPTILAEFSQCLAMLRIYGEGVPVNDIYLFTACHLGKLGDEIKKYYDPMNPTPASIEAAKKHCKRERNISKTCCLAANYQAGPKKIFETLTLGGVDITLMEVMKIHRDYWKLYAGVKRFQAQLEVMWEQNDGWIVNGAGRPICVAEFLKKDLLNRFCQSTASDFLTMFVRKVYRNCAAAGLRLTPWLSNFYDETIGECREEDAEAVAAIYVESLRELNAELGMSIRLKGDPLIANTLADIKVG